MSHTRNRKKRLSPRTKEIAQMILDLHNSDLKSRLYAGMCMLVKELLLGNRISKIECSQWLKMIQRACGFAQSGKQHSYIYSNLELADHLGVTISMSSCGTYMTDSLDSLIYKTRLIRIGWLESIIHKDKVLFL